MNTVNDVAKKLGVTPQAIYQQIANRTELGRKFYHVPGKGYRIDAKDLEVKKNG